MKNRKFLLILIIIGLSFALVLLNKLDSKYWIDTMKTIIGLYIAGNVGQKIGLNLNNLNNKKKRR